MRLHNSAGLRLPPVCAHAILDPTIIILQQFWLSEFAASRAFYRPIFAAMRLISSIHHISADEGVVVLVGSRDFLVKRQK
jgi:hypothetical protein